MKNLPALLIVSLGVARVAVAEPAPSPPPTAPTGLYELVSYVKGTETTVLHDAMVAQFKGQAMDVVDVRMTFDLQPQSLTVQTFMFEREKDGSGSVCDAQLTLDISWKGMSLVIPSGGKAESRFIRVTKNVKKEGAKTSSKSSRDENTCDASLQATTLKAVYNGNVLWFETPTGAHYVMMPMKAPIAMDRESLAARL